MKSFLSIILIIQSGIAQQPARPAVRALPDDNLSYPVLITFKSGTGSGFYVNTNTGMYLVTAKHVLFDPATGLPSDTSFELLSYSKDLSDLTPNVLVVDMNKAGMANFVRHPSEDVAVFKILVSDPLTPQKGDAVAGVTIKSLSKSGFLGVGVENIKKFDEVLVGNDVIVLGYPTSLGLQNMPQIDTHRALLRKGIIAGTNPKTHSIILDCPVYFGNSGGPAIESDAEGFEHRFKIIGVISQYVPYADGGKTFVIMANSGYSVVTPMDYVLELIK